MHNNLLKGVSAVFGAMALSSAAMAADVNIWNWSDYMGETTVADFEKAANLDANYAMFDSNELVEARLLSGHSGFDVTMMTSYYIPRLAKAGALEKLDKSLLSNYDKLDKKRMEMLASIDEGNNYAIPFAEISLGFGYNQEKIDEIFGKGTVIDKWEFIFNKENSRKLKKCGIAVLDSPIEVISSVMHYLKQDPKSEKAADYAKAKELLTSLATDVSYFHSSRYINDLASGDICFAIGYSGDILQAADRAVTAKRGYTIKYEFPRDGSLLWYDCWAIPKGASNFENGHKWINFLMEKEVASSVSNQIRYILPVTDAMELLATELKENKSVNLDEEHLKAAYFPTPPTAKVSRITNNIWNYMKLNSDNEDDGSGWE